MVGNHHFHPWKKMVGHGVPGGSGSQGGELTIFIGSTQLRLQSSPGWHVIFQALGENPMAIPINHCISHRIHGRNGIFTYSTWMVDFYGINVGKYTVRPMDPMDIWYLPLDSSVGSRSNKLRNCCENSTVRLVKTSHLTSLLDDQYHLKYLRSKSQLQSSHFNIGVAQSNCSVQFENKSGCSLEEKTCVKQSWSISTSISPRCIEAPI